MHLTAATFTACALLTALTNITAAELPAQCTTYESIPLPVEAKSQPPPTTPPACASYRSYRGIGRPVNYPEARACAWQERLAQQASLGQNQKEPTAWIVGGSLILADIYFNGAGVKRDVPLAMRFACEAEDGMAMLALRDIAKTSSPPPTRAFFEFCDYAASTMTMGFCSGYQTQIREENRNRFFDSLRASMPPQQAEAFRKLLAAQKAYIDAHAAEVDQGGTIRAIRTMGSQNILKDLFHKEVVQFERKKWPSLSPDQIRRADALLDREYKKTLERLAQPGEIEDESRVTPAQVSRVEKIWEAYRAAWVAFANSRYASAAAAIRAQITIDRYRLLRTIR